MLCISDPLQGVHVKKHVLAQLPALSTLEACVSLLKKNASKALRDILVNALESFMVLEPNINRVELLDGVVILFTRCMQAAQQDSAMRTFIRLSRTNPSLGTNNPTARYS